MISPDTNEKIDRAYEEFKRAVKNRNPRSEIEKTLDVLLDLSSSTPSFQKYVRSFLPMCGIPRMTSNQVIHTFGTLLLDVTGEDTNREIFDPTKYLRVEKTHYATCRQSDEGGYSEKFLDRWSTEIDSRSRSTALT